MRDRSHPPELLRQAAAARAEQGWRVSLTDTDFAAAARALAAVRDH